MARELPKIYEPQQVENRIYDMWQEGGYFHAEKDESKKPFTIVMPPPNVTGQLHMGHAMDATLQDTLIPFAPCFIALEIAILIARRKAILPSSLDAMLSATS